MFSRGEKSTQKKHFLWSLQVKYQQQQQIQQQHQQTTVRTNNNKT